MIERRLRRYAGYPPEDLILTCCVSLDSASMRWGMHAGDRGDSQL